MGIGEWETGNNEAVGSTRVQSLNFLFPISCFLVFGESEIGFQDALGGDRVQSCPQPRAPRSGCTQVVLGLE